MSPETVVYATFTNDYVINGLPEKLNEAQFEEKLKSVITQTSEAKFEVLNANATTIMGGYSYSQTAGINLIRCSTTYNKCTTSGEGGGGVATGTSSFLSYIRTRQRVTKTYPATNFKWVDTTPDAYTSSEIKSVINVTNNLIMGGVVASTGSSSLVDPFVPGVNIFTMPLSLSCVSQPIQLSFTLTPTVDFGHVTNNATPLSRNITATITSGTEIPAGTITFTSTNAKSNGRLSLGGGEVTLKLAGTEVSVGTPVPITSRDMTFEVELNPGGATPGEATTNLRMDMVVD
ncbi:hypothetical protein [Citrobacter braakii]|uniref:hypothetical protein n=1 Tax=Citrobacter braakii TaxID=57706 RepID=UPI0030803FA8